VLLAAINLLVFTSSGSRASLTQWMTCEVLKTSSGVGVLSPLLSLTVGGHNLVAPIFVCLKIYVRIWELLNIVKRYYKKENL
jgi:hypothetical protein